MELKTIRDTYYGFSAEASKAARALALAGIAIVWVFTKETQSVPEPLLWPLGLFVATLAMDWLHYFTSALMWGWYGRYREKNDKYDDYPAPKTINWLNNALWFLKVVTIGPAYVLVFLFLLDTIYPGAKSP